MMSPAGEPLAEKGQGQTTAPTSEPGCFRKVILCDPDPTRTARLLPVLADGLELIPVTTLESLTRLCREQVVLAVALPLDWPGPASMAGNGIDSPVLQFIRSHRHQFAVIVYADKSQLPVEVYCRALCAGAREVLNEASPSFASDLGATLTDLVRNYQLQWEEEKKLGRLFAELNLIGQSPALREVFRRAQRASHFNDLPVLILGETGTGKQRLAEAIHCLDLKRSQKPFLTVNCSAISKTLAESELFGHTKGAFSGAGQERAGVFRAADGGTLLLDEVGELDLELQPKLLRVLQERRLLPVGADYEYPINIRIIAATNRSLEDMVAAGKFRADLYQRLNVFQIRMPPLRERPEDIELQARHFLKVYQDGREHRLTGFAPGVLDALCTLSWEGNTRHLENLVRETLTFRERGGLVQLEDLPGWALEKLANPSPSGPEDMDETLMVKIWPKQLSLTKAVAEYEQALLRHLLEKNRGNRSRTAKDLGLTPRTLYNKIRKYQLQ